MLSYMILTFLLSSYKNSIYILSNTKMVIITIYRKYNTVHLPLVYKVNHCMSYMCP